MEKRKPRIFLASTFEGLEKERRALIKLFQRYEDWIDFRGYEKWLGGASPDLESRVRARESDYLFLIIGARYGSRDPRRDTSITQLEYEEFLYTHVQECRQLGDVSALYVFEKDESSIEPEDADVPGENKDDLSRFKDHIRKRFSIPIGFRNWLELQKKVDAILKKIPHHIPAKKYRKVSINQFDFKILGFGPFREDHLEVIGGNCPCIVHQNGACDFDSKLHFRPPADLRNEMQRHLRELFDDPNINPQWKKPNKSFKTINIRTVGPKLQFTFCHSTWHQFLGTNQAATKDETIRNMLKTSFSHSFNLEKSPFSNNLGFTVAVIDSEAETLYYTFRKDVSVHPNMKAASISTQLHAYDTKHLENDGLPNIFGAAYEELINEANIQQSDIRDFYIAAWGIGTRTGTPELLFICDTTKPLSKIYQDVCEAGVSHFSEFDREQMKKRNGIVYDYELLADLDANPDFWEPESAVACCLALNSLVRGCVSIDDDEHFY